MEIFLFEDSGNNLALVMTIIPFRKISGSGAGEEELQQRSLSHQHFYTVSASLTYIVYRFACCQVTDWGLTAESIACSHNCAAVILDAAMDNLRTGPYPAANEKKAFRSSADRSQTGARAPANSFIHLQR